MSPDAERLFKTAETTFETLSVAVDRDVVELVEGLVATAARTLEEEGRGGEEAAIKAAEARLVYVLTTASIRTETAELRLDYLQSFPDHATFLDAASLSEFLRGICPIWPFCT